MADFTVSARLQGDASGLVAAAKQGADGLDALQARAASVSRGATSSAGDYVAAERQRAAAIAATGKELDTAAGKLSTYQKTQLGFQLNDVFTQLASGQGVLRTAVQQGPQITQVFGGIAETFKAIPAVALGAVAAIGLVTGAVALGSSAYAAATERAQKYELQLDALGRAGQINVQQVTGSIDRVAALRGYGRDAVGEGVQQFFDAGIFDPATVDRGLQSARALGLALGTDLPSQAKVLGAALAGSGDALDQLDRKLDLLSDAQRTQVRSLQEMGRAADAQKVILDAVGGRFDTLANQALTTGQKISSSVGEAWSRALENFGKTDVIQSAAEGIKILGDRVADALGPRTGTAVEQLRAVEAEISAIQAKRGSNYADIGAAQQLYSLQQEQARLQQAVSQQGLAAETPDALAAALGIATPRALDEETKSVRALAEQLDTLPRQREAISNAITRIWNDIAQGKVAADVAGGALDALYGKLSSLHSPFEQSFADLNNAQELANTPLADRARVQARQQAEREAQSLPPSQRGDFLANRESQFNAQFIQRSQDVLQGLSAAATYSLDIARAWSQGPAAALRAQAIGAGTEQARQGAIGAGDIGPYAADVLGQGAAGELVSFAATTQGYREQTEALQRLVAAEGQGSAAAREAQRANEVAAATSKLRAAVEAAGSDTISAAAAKQIAAYEELSRQQAEAQRQREAQQFNQQFDPAVAYQQNIAKLADLQATGLLTERTVVEATKQYELQRLEASRDATEGMIAGLKRYADEATNAGASAASGIRSAMSSAEDAVAQFATTGAINVGNLANSIIGDIARVAARKYVLGPLADAFGSALGSIFGSGSGGGQSIGAIYSGPYHSGGTVGASLGIWRSYPAALWANARRYHDGGFVLGASEVPIIAQKGERVLTKQQQDQLSGGGLTVNIIDQAGVKVTPRKSAGPGGVPRLDVLIEPIERALAANVSAGRGPLTDAIAGSFGVALQGRG